MPGHGIEIADAEQAYIQADLHGTETWVCLPPEARSKEMKKFYRPVVQLKKALYGHPDSGTSWEEHCDSEARHAGFMPVGPTWPSCYFNKKLELYLVTYVDDFKLAGPKANLTEGWKLLRRGLTIEP